MNRGILLRPTGLGIAIMMALLLSLGVCACSSSSSTPAVEADEPAATNFTEVFIDGVR